jgi:hypothetical protein
MLMRSVLFSGIMQRQVGILYQCFRTTYWSHLQGSRSPRRVALQMGLICCPEMSEKDYHSSLHYTLEKRRSHMPADVYHIPPGCRVKQTATHGTTNKQNHHYVIDKCYVTRMFSLQSVLQNTKLQILLLLNSNTVWHRWSMGLAVSQLSTFINGKASHTATCKIIPSFMTLQYY